MGRKIDWEADRAMGPKGKAACGIGLDRTLDKSKRYIGQPPTLARNRPRRRLGGARPSAYSASALAPQEPPKSRECPASSGLDRENRTR
jgi:hypothetical protein